MGKKSDVTDALIFTVVVMAVLYFGAKMYWQNFEKCRATGRTDDECSDLLR